MPKGSHGRQQRFQSRHVKTADGQTGASVKDRLRHKLQSRWRLKPIVDRVVRVFVERQLSHCTLAACLLTRELCATLCPLRLVGGYKCFDGLGFCIGHVWLTDPDGRTIDPASSIIEASAPDAITDSVLSLQPCHEVRSPLSEEMLHMIRRINQGESDALISYWKHAPEALRLARQDLVTVTPSSSTTRSPPNETST